MTTQLAQASRMTLDGLPPGPEAQTLPAARPDAGDEPRDTAPALQPNRILQLPRVASSA